MGILFILLLIFYPIPTIVFCVLAAIGWGFASIGTWYDKNPLK